MAEEHLLPLIPGIGEVVDSDERRNQVFHEPPRRDHRGEHHHAVDGGYLRRPQANARGDASDELVREHEDEEPHQRNRRKLEEADHDLRRHELGPGDNQADDDDGEDADQDGAG